MKHVSDLFEKYKKTITAPQASVEKECIQVITTVTGFELLPDSVIYTPSTRTLTLHVPSVVKQEIKLQQAEILQALNRKLGTSAPTMLL